MPEEFAKQSQVDDHERRLTVLEKDLTHKVEQLVLAVVEMKTSFATALAMVKGAPVVISLLAVIIGGIIWLIKHA